MPLTHAEFKEVREEIETNIVDKTIASIFGRSWKWLGIGATVMAFGGWAAFDRLIDKMAEENRLQIEALTQKLDVEFQEARYQNFQIEQSRERIQRAQSEVMQTQREVESNKERSQSALDLIEKAEGSLRSLWSQYELDQPYLLYYRDRLAWQVAMVEKQLLDQPPVSLPAWGESKIVILREQPAKSRVEEADDAQAARLGAAVFRLRGLSSRVRIALASQGYEVVEWETRAERRSRDISELFTAANPPEYDPFRPILFSNPEFAGPNKDAAALAGLLELTGLESISSVSSADFEPEPIFRMSHGNVLNDQPIFEPSQVAVLFLPLAIFENQ